MIAKNQIVAVCGVGDYHLLGTTIDDAIGEARRERAPDEPPRSRDQHPSLLHAGDGKHLAGRFEAP